jgi:hypothetical protein
MLQLDGNGADQQFIIFVGSTDTGAPLNKPGGFP